MDRATAVAEPSRQRRAHHLLCLIALTLLSFSTGALPARAQTREDTNEIPQLRPLHAELTRSFWEKYGLVVIVMGIALLILIGFVVWILTRPQPAPFESPAAQARKALNALPENMDPGQRLSQASVILRQYVRGAFRLPPDELTTPEFCRLIATHQPIGPKLATELTRFFHENDRHKFSAEPISPLSMNAVSEALSLIEKGEARLASAQTSTPPA